jgi:hypothetical protein
MLVIQVPIYFYLPLVIVLSVVWAIWIAKDVLGRDLAKYGVKRKVLGYIGSGVVIAFHWMFLVASSERS